VVAGAVIAGLLMIAVLGTSVITALQAAKLPAPFESFVALLNNLDQQERVIQTLALIVSAVVWPLYDRGVELSRKRTELRPVFDVLEAHAPAS